MAEKIRLPDRHQPGTVHYRNAFVPADRAAGHELSVDQSRLSQSGRFAAV